MSLKKLHFLSISLALASATLLSSFDAQAGSVAPKREFRSTWFTTHVNIDWPQTRGTSASVVAKQKADMITYIEGFERMNLNGACFQVRAQCDAVYKSSYEPWSAVLSGTRGTDPGWDPLAYCIEECHKRGLECYAWINPFRWSTGTDYKTPQDMDFKAKGWILNYGSYYVLNPAIPEAREHILKVCKEIVDKYAIDGVLFDDYFYPNNIPENSSAGDWNLYKASGTSMSIGDWRRENINIFVREFQKMIETSHPDMRFGISPAGVAYLSGGKYGISKPNISASDWQYGTIYSDPLAWLAEGSIDFISPQIYWQTYHNSAPYEPLCDWWSAVADKFGRHFYSSQNVYFFPNDNNATSWKEVATQVELNRKYAEPTVQNAPGTIYYSSKYFYGPSLSGLGDYLLDNVNRTKALVPVVTWKKVAALDKPADLKFDGSKLTWTDVDKRNLNVRYTVYAVPLSETIQNASDNTGDGISNDYLLKVSYTNSFEIPQDRRTGYWYAVCAYDGLGNEYEPAVVGYPQGESAKVSLTSPAEGATVSWNETFEWTSVSSASYILRIYADKDCSDIVLTTDVLDRNSYQPDLSELTPKTSYYWNVTCIEPGKLSTVSDTRSFNTGDYATLPSPSLLTPTENADEKDDIAFTWTESQGATSYRFQISATPDFVSTQYEATTEATSLNLNASYIGRGKHYWRVIAQAPLSHPSCSDIRTFNVTEITVGSTEPGYVIKKDNTEYPAAGSVRVENLWMRSNRDDFKNMSFESDGSLQRGMLALGDYVYLTRRSENAEGAMLYIEQYDGYTGEHVKTITLSDEARAKYYPLNTIVADDEGNVVISNLTTDATTTPVVLHHVNLDSGEAREIARFNITGLAKARVDHVNVTGNVATGNFTVYVPVASATELVRIDYVNGEPSKTTMSTFKNFYPADRTSFTIAPFITPISYDRALVNGGGIGLGIYDFATKTLVENISDCEGAVAKATTANGSARFTLGLNRFTVYTATDHTQGFTFGLVESPDDLFANAKVVANFPEGGLGNVNSGTASTPISVVKDSEGSARIYVYAAGNGLAAYRLQDLASFATEGLYDNDAVKAVRRGAEVSFSRQVGNVTVYTISGLKVVQTENVSSLTLPDGNSRFIVVAEGRSFKL